MTWAIFETYVVACVIYFVLTFSITRILRWVERKSTDLRLTLFIIRPLCWMTALWVREGSGLMNSTVVEIKGLKKTFGENKVLKE